MRRSRTLPIETMAAISLVVAASLLALVVLVRDAADGADTERAALEASNRSAVTTVPTDPEDPDDPAGPDGPADPPRPGERSTTSAVAPTTTSSPTTAPASGPDSTPTTTTSTPPPLTPTSVVAGPPECPGLVSESFWTATGEPSTLHAAAGGQALYSEVVTNTSDEPCTLQTNRCGTTAELFTGSGEATDPAPQDCTSQATEVVLEPNEERTERLTAAFPVPPGDYDVHVRRYDGTIVSLPVHLDDRLPPCDTEGLGLRVDDEDQVRQRSELRESGFSVRLVLTGVPESCSVRTVESLIHLELDGQQIDIADATDRWLAGSQDAGILTHIVVPAGDIPTGEYAGRVVMVLASGEMLSAPFQLAVR